ncbi:tetratricopeptide repeat protein [Aquimarina algiphila]|uniref:tetratricopeptide repeat protein n=1 Tax=Aquimarina algiphila TaxID=2047982 RepID=UPI00232DB14F|nr:tetratricopeptide repeat protein [Aquimarina algiphila]
MTTNIIPISKTTSIALWTLCCMLFLSTTGYAQTTVDTIPASQYFAKADTLLTHRKLDSAIVYFKKALPIYTKAKSWERVARYYNKISECQWRDKKYKESLTNAKQAIAISDQYLPKNNREKAYGFDNIGQYFYSKRLNYKKASLFYQKALKIKLMVFPKDHLFVAGSYLNIGNALLMWRKYDEALEYYKKAIIIWEDKLGADHIDISDLYFNMSLVYFNKQKYDKALLYSNKSF